MKVKVFKCYAIWLLQYLYLLDNAIMKLLSTSIDLLICKTVRLKNNDFVMFHYLWVTYTEYVCSINLCGDKNKNFYVFV